MDPTTPHARPPTVPYEVTRMSYDRIGAVAVAAGPLILLAGLVWHPVIVDLTDKAAVVDAMAADTTRWLGAHLVAAIGAAAVLLSFLAARAHIRSTVGHEAWTAAAVTPLVVGTVLFAILPGMEMAMLAAKDSGADLLATQQALDKWFRPILLLGSLIFAIGSVLFAIGVLKAAILPTGSTWTVVVALVVSALSRFVPSTVSLLIGVVALVVAMVPLALSMWRVGRAPHPSTVTTG